MGSYKILDPELFVFVGSLRDPCSCNFDFCMGFSGILNAELFLRGILDLEVMILRGILGILDPSLVFAWDLGDIVS